MQKEFIEKVSESLGSLIDWRMISKLLSPGLIVFELVVSLSDVAEIIIFIMAHVVICNLMISLFVHLCFPQETIKPPAATIQDTNESKEDLTTIIKAPKMTIANSMNNNDESRQPRAQL